MSNTKKYAIILAASVGTLVLIGLTGLFTGHTGLTIGVVTLLVGLSALASSLTLVSGRSGQRRLARSISTVERRVRRNQENVTRRLQRHRDDIKKLAPLVNRVHEEIGRSEVRLLANLQEPLSEGCCQPSATMSDIVHEIVAQDALHRIYDPEHPVATGPVLPSSILSLSRVTADLGPRSILAVNMGAQAVWLAHACPGARVGILILADDEEGLAAEIARQPHSSRIEPIVSPAGDPGLEHSYGTWFLPGERLTPVDTIVMGRCTQEDFPAPFVLAPHTQDSAHLVLPPDHDPDVVAAWIASGVVLRTASGLALRFARGSHNPTPENVSGAPR